MSIKPTKFVRKPFFVDVVKVTLENMDEVAQWCGGIVLTTKSALPYIKINVFRPMNERQTRAYVNDLVVNSGNGFKIYIQSAFDKTFEEVIEKN